MLWLTRIPIFRRLCGAFALAVLLPISVVAWILANSIQFLAAHNGEALAKILLFQAIVAGVVIFLIVFIVGILIAWTITRPLGQLAALARRIREGDRSARATPIGQDDIAVVAASINLMLENIVRLLQETEGQRDHLQSQVDKLLHEVSGVGEGDLRIQAEVTPDALGVLADAFNYMVQELSNLIIQVKNVAIGVEEMTGVTQQQTRHLLTIATTQLGQIGTASTTVQRMAEASLQVAERTNILEQSAQQSYQAAQSGREAVKHLDLGIKQIQENVQEAVIQTNRLGGHSRDIDEIINLIRDIALLTNRLALDAAVQSAMAGEQGAGFMAIADGIRRLAERTQDQAQTVSGVVHSILDEIGKMREVMITTERETKKGVAFTQNITGTFSTIFGAVELQAGEIRQINHMAKSQAHSLQETVAIMQAVSATTREGSSSAKVIAQRVQQMTSLVAQLRQSVEAFNLNASATTTIDQMQVMFPHENWQESNI